MNKIIFHEANTFKDGDLRVLATEGGPRGCRVMRCTVLNLLQHYVESGDSASDTVGRRCGSSPSCAIRMSGAERAYPCNSRRADCGDGLGPRRLADNVIGLRRGSDDRQAHTFVL